MTPKYEKRGSGMSERNYVENSPAALRKMFDDMAAGYVEPLEGQALEILKQAKITSRSNEFVGGWLGIAESCGFAEDSPQGYAARILEQIRCVRSVMKTGDPAEVHRQSFDLGSLWKEAVLKFEWEVDALHGRKKSDALREVSRRANAERAEAAAANREKWQAEADKIWSRHLDCTASNVAREIVKSKSGNWDTIRRKIKRKKKLSPLT